MLHYGMLEFLLKGGMEKKNKTPASSFFNRRPWLKEYNDFNTQLGKKANTNFSLYNQGQGFLWQNSRKN